MKNSILILLILLSTAIYSQNKNSIDDEILFTKAITLLDAIDEIVLYKDENEIDIEIIKPILKKLKSEALNNFNELIEKHPKSQHLFMSLFHKGNFEYELNNFAIAKETFIKVINFEEKESGSYYKNRALRILAWMAIEEKDYSQAIKYLNASKEQKVIYTCGTAYNVDKTQLENMYKIAESGLSENKK